MEHPQKLRLNSGVIYPSGIILPAAGNASIVEKNEARGRVTPKKP
jgi:hypothetical protein